MISGLEGPGAMEIEVDEDHENGDKRARGQIVDPNQRYEYGHGPEARSVTAEIGR